MAPNETAPLESRISFMEATLKGMSGKMDTIQTTLNQLTSSLTTIAVVQERTKSHGEAIQRAFDYTEKLHRDLADHVKADQIKFDNVRTKIDLVEREGRERSEKNKEEMQKYLNRWVGACAALSTLATLASLVALWLKYFIS